PVEFTQILHAKSSGNPLYLKQLVHSSLRNQWIRFDPNQAQWVWERDRVAGLPGFEGQLDHLVDKIHALSPVVQQVLQTASCLGSAVRIEDLRGIDSIAEPIIESAIE